ASFLPVHHRQDAENPSTLRGYCGDRLRRRVPGGNHVLHDDDRDTGPEAAFDAPCRTVAFRLLADREGVEGPPLGPGGGRPGVGAGAVASAAATSAANAVTVGWRRLGSRSRPRITAASSAGGKRRPAPTWLSDVGSWVSSCWNSSRGVRPLCGCCPVSIQYAIVARL